MTLHLLYPPGPLYAHYRATEEALDYARKLHEHQLALQAAYPEHYDTDVHATVLVFNLRFIGRKIHALAASFRTCIQPGQSGGLSGRTIDLQTALQHFNAAVAARDAWNNTVGTSVNILELAFNCLASLEEDILMFEQLN